MTTATEIFEQTWHDDTFEQNFAIFLTKLAVIFQDLVASVNEQSFFVFESIQIDILIRFHVHESFCEHLKKNFDDFDARIEMIDTFIQSCRDRNYAAEWFVIQIESIELILSVISISIWISRPWNQIEVIWFDSDFVDSNSVN